MKIQSSSDEKLDLIINYLKYYGPIFIRDWSDLKPTPQKSLPLAEISGSL